MAALDFSSFGDPVEAPDFSGFGELAEPAKADSGLRRIGDVGVDLSKSVVGFGESLVGIADIVSFGAAGKVMQSLGYEPKQTRAFLSDFYSSQRKAANLNVEQADGFVDTALALIQNPSVLAGHVVEAIPGTAAIAGLGYQVASRSYAAATAAARAAGVTDAAQITAAGRAAVQEALPKILSATSATEGAQAAGSIAEQARQEGREWADYVLPSIGGGAGTAAISKGVGTFGASTLGRKLGIGSDLEAGIASAAAGGGVAGATGGLLARTGKAALREGVLEEMPQSAQEQVFQNLALGKPAGEGVGAAAATGLLTGGVMGGAHAALAGEPAQRTVAAVKPILQAPDVDAAIAAANRATDPMFVSDIDSSAMSGGIIAEEMAGASARAERLVAEQAVRDQGWEQRDADARARDQAAQQARAEVDGRTVLERMEALEQQRRAPIASQVTQAAQQGQVGGLGLALQRALGMEEGEYDRQDAAPAAAAIAAQPTTGATNATVPTDTAQPSLLEGEFGAQPDAVASAPSASASPAAGEAGISAATGRDDSAASGGAGTQLEVAGDNLGRDVAQLPAVKQRLFVVSPGGQRFEVASLEDASRKWEQVRDTMIRDGRGGVSAVGSGTRIVDEQGTEVGRIAYNGRVFPPGEWKPGATPLYEPPGRRFSHPSNRMESGTPVDAAAHEAATSPKNALPEPTEAQKDAGNYRKGHVRISGMEVSIENPAGSKRRPEWTALKDNYGYIVGVPAKAADKEHVDVFIKPGTTDDFAGDVFVVGQYKKNGAFDEPKAVIGASSLDEAAALYRRNYSADWNGGKKITPMPMAEFQRRLQDPQAFTHEQPGALDMPAIAKPVLILGRTMDKFTRKALGVYAKKANSAAQRAAAQAEIERRDAEIANRPLSEAEIKRREEASVTWKAKAAQRKTINADDSLVQAIIKLGGLRSDLRKEVSGDVKNRGIPGVGYLFAKNGRNLDEMALLLQERGFLSQADIDAASDTGGTRLLVDRIDAELKGNKTTYAGTGGAEEQYAADRDRRNQIEQEMADRYIAEQQNAVTDEAAALSEEEQAAGFDAADVIISTGALGDAELDAILGADSRPTPQGQETGAQPGAPAQGQAGQEKAEEVASEREPGSDDEAPSAERPSLDLIGQTESQARTEDLAKQRADEERRKQEAAPPPEEFTLAGSNRSADQAVARGQTELFGAQSAAPANPIAQAADALIQAANAMKAAVAPQETHRAPVSTPKPEGRIVDAGENLWANRRNFTRGAIGWDAIKDLNDALKIKEVVKAKVWPKPDYEELIAQGMEPFFARMLKHVYDGIATSPAGKSDEDLQRYIDVVGRVRNAVFDWAKDNNANRAFLDQLAARAKAMQGRRISMMDMVSGQGSIRDVILDRVWPMGEGVRRFRSGTESLDDIRSIGANRALKALQFTMDDAVDAMKDIDKGWPKSQGAWQRQGYQVLERDKALTVRKQEQPGEKAPIWVIEINGKYSTYSREEVTAERIAPAKWIVVDKRHNIVGQQETEEQAKEAARELVKREAKGGDIRGMNIEAAERTGPERRQPGENVTAERLMEEFGFRGVNFGRESYINQAERQAYLNHAYDGLIDLAEIMDVPPKALSLNGMLGLAFGAQGRGGHAAAHFVPGHNEINLTKTMGAGTLAHEWGHALDHYFAVQAGFAKIESPFLSYKLGTNVGSDIRPEIVKAFKTVVEAMEKRPMTEAETAAREQMTSKRSIEDLEKWIQHFRKDIERAAPDKLPQFDQFADRMRKGDRGEGYVRVGQQTLSAVVGEVKALVKGIKGASTNIASNWKGLESNASHVAYRLEQKDATKEHVPQTTSTAYAGESSAKDRDKGGKPYWRTPWEMFARAFETYVASRLADLSRANTFLSDAALRAESKDRSGGFAMPYPRGEDRERINAAMDKLVQAIETKETDRGVAMFSRGSMFSDAMEFASKVDDFIAGRFGPLPIRVTATPDVLLKLDVQDRDLQVAPRILEKAMEGKHGLSASVVKSIVRELHDPIAVFDSATQPGSLVILTSQESEGRPVVVVVAPDVQHGRMTVHAIASVHPREHRSDVETWTEKGLLNYLNESKRPAWWTTGELRLLKVGPTAQGAMGRILTEQDLVKGAFSRGGAGGMDIALVRDIVDKIKSGWANAPTIRVIDSMAEAPAAVREKDEAQRSEGATGEPRAFYHRGTVYLVAGALKSPRAITEALFHETLGHHGLRGAFGERLNKVLDIVASGQRSRVEAKARQYGLDMNDVNERRAAAEEVLAEIAEARPESGLVKRAIAAIRQFLRDIGLKLDLSDNDIVQQFIVPARGFVERGRTEAATGEAVPAFGRGDATGRDWTVDEARKQGFTLKAYRGIDKSSPFNESGTVWASTNRDVAEAYTRDVWGYDEPDVVEVYVKPEGIPQHDIRKLTLEQAAELGAFGDEQSPQAIGIYRNSDDSPLGSNYPHTAIHVPAANVWVPGRGVLGDGAASFQHGGQSTDTFDASNPDSIRFSRTGTIQGDYRDATAAGAASFVRDFLHSDKRFNWWHRTIGTQQHKALVNQAFRRVYDRGQAFLSDVSKYANEAADLANAQPTDRNGQDLLPRIERLRDFWKKTPKDADLKKVSGALYAGTLWGDGSPMEGRIWSDEELRAGQAVDSNVHFSAFEPLNDAQIKLYRQALAATSKGLEDLGKSIIHKLARQHNLGFDREQSLEDVVGGLNEAIDEQLSELRLQLEEAREFERDDVVTRTQDQIRAWQDLRQSIVDVQQKTAGLQQAGYFPAMRFGQYAIHVTEDDGEGGTRQMYFGLYESQTKANLAARELAKEYPDAEISRGMISKEQHRLFNGLSLDALEAFADYITDEKGQPIARDPLVQGFLKAAVSERSAMKRHIHRKGISGYSDDLPRVLASFVTSTARATASNYHSAPMLQAANDIRAGDVKDEAIKLVRYLTDPQEEAQAIRGFLFAQFLGGSIAHGIVNMTQPFMVTIPWLSQHTSAADAAAKIGQAAGAKADKLRGEERDAYERAKKEGVVAPQEIHQLRAETGGMPLGRSLALRKLSFLWGSIYAITEQFNRTTAFLAAYRVAKEKNLGNPYAFAKRAVEETQFVYNKGNRANWARGPIGATVFTFKQFSISYLELAKRVYGKDKKAFALMALALIAAAGLEGLPFAEDFEDLVDTIGQWMGYSTNSKKKLRRWATAMLGPDLAQVALRGISGLPWMPVDVSVRMGLQNLIPGTGMLKLSEKNKARDVLELAGPVGQFVPTDDTMMGKALDRIAKGDWFGAVKSGTPVAVQNVAKGAEMYQRGYATDSKGKKITPVTPGEAVFKMAGLQPASVARESRKIGEVAQDIDLQKRMESEIAEQWARGRVDNDPEAVRSAMKKLHDWNRDNSELRIKINSDQIRRRMKELRTPREERFIKSAPPEIRGGVREALRQ